MTRPPATVTASLHATLEEFDAPRPAAGAESACGRLAALELASALGIRRARRALARERQTLLRQCFPSLDIGIDAGDDP